MDPGGSIRLGRTSLTVSRLGVGTARLTERTRRSDELVTDADLSTVRA